MTHRLNAEDVAKQINTIVVSGVLSELRWPNFSANRQDVQKVYEVIHYAPAWVQEGHATSQALTVISALERSQQKGLNPEDYDASLWPTRLDALKAAPDNLDTVAHFDVALTVSTLRYLSNLRVGRLNPKPVAFNITLGKDNYDLPRFLVQKVLTSGTVTEALNDVEPQYLEYKRTEAALQTYETLASQDHSEPLPDVQRTVTTGKAYANIEQLDKRLRLLGDLPQRADAIANNGVYSEPLAAAVKHFQGHHGLTADGRLDQGTLHQLNTRLSDRVLQLEDSLERWRWLPADYPESPVMVNIPGFMLRVFSDDHHVAMRMNVVVGKALQHQTPVFAKNMKYIIFRPYWNVPLDITLADIIPGIRKNSHYLARKGFEVTDQNGRVIAKGAVSASTLAQMKSGRLMVRQRPGPSNSLGLVKFMFPNEYDVYLHSTPAPEFSRDRGATSAMGAFAWRNRRNLQRGCSGTNRSGHWRTYRQPCNLALIINRLIYPHRRLS